MNFLSATQGLGTIIDNDPMPSLAVNDVSTIEPDAGTTNAVFTILLSAPSGRTVTFTPGTTTRTFTVPVRGDVVVESAETYTVVLDSQTNATLGDAIGVGTIVNDD